MNDMDQVYLSTKCFPRTLPIPPRNGKGEQEPVPGNEKDIGTDIAFGFRHPFPPRGGDGGGVFMHPFPPRGEVAPAHLDGRGPVIRRTRVRLASTGSSPDGG